MEAKKFHWESDSAMELDGYGCMYFEPTEHSLALNLSEDFDRVTAERDALQQRLNAVEEENDRLRAVEAAAKEMLRIAGIAKQGSNAYNRAITHLHQTLEAKS